MGYKIIIYENDNNNGKSRKEGYENLKKKSGVDEEGVGPVRKNDGGEEYLRLGESGDDARWWR